MAKGGGSDWPGILLLIVVVFLVFLLLPGMFLLGLLRLIGGFEMEPRGMWVFALILSVAVFALLQVLVSKSFGKAVLHYLGLSFTVLLLFLAAFVGLETKWAATMLEYYTGPMEKETATDIENPEAAPAVDIAPDDSSATGESTTSTDNGVLLPLPDGSSQAPAALIEEREHQHRERQRLQRELDEVNEALVSLNEESERIAKAERCMEKIRMYKAAADRPGIREIIDSEEAKLKNLGNVTAEDIKQYKETHAKLLERRENLESRIRDLP